MNILKHNINQILFALKNHLSSQGRHMIAIAGAPASGKSTIAEALVKRMNLEGMSSALMPMDGFHLDNSILEARGRLQRKGAPDTFDVKSLISFIERMHRGETVIAPSFDRSIDQSIASAIKISSEIDWIVVEGNYLLLEDEPWNKLYSYFDLTVFLTVDEHELKARLMQRWLSYGFNEQDAKIKIEQNDLQNARHIIRHSIPAMITLS